MSLLEETPAAPSSRPRLGNYLLPGLVLLNVWLLLALTGVLPTFFGDQPDPARLERQIDAERVKVLPAVMGTAELAPGEPPAAAQPETPPAAESKPAASASGAGARPAGTGNAARQSGNR